VLYGGQEASRGLADQLALRGQGFGEAQQGLQNAASIRGQLLGERGMLRSNQFNELATILGLQQVKQPGMENFFSPGQAGVTDAYGLEQASVQNAFNAVSGRNASAKGAGANLAGMLGSAFIGKGR
jgi:hypothetical protein